MEWLGKEEEAPVVDVVGSRLTVAFSSRRQVDVGDHLEQLAHQKDAPGYRGAKGHTGMTQGSLELSEMSPECCRSWRR
jgi:hypothetical protein